MEQLRTEVIDSQIVEQTSLLKKISNAVEKLSGVAVAPVIKVEPEKTLSKELDKKFESFQTTFKKEVADLISAKKEPITDEGALYHTPTTALGKILNSVTSHLSQTKNGSTAGAKYLTAALAIIALVLAGGIIYNAQLATKKIADLKNEQTKIIYDAGAPSVVKYYGKEPVPEEQKIPVKSETGIATGTGTGTTGTKIIYVLGKQGPAGPKGIQGVPGVAGPSGEKGSDGKDGLAWAGNPVPPWLYAPAPLPNTTTTPPTTIFSATDLSTTRLFASTATIDDLTINNNANFNGPLKVLAHNQPQLTVGYDTGNQWYTSTTSTGATTFTFKGTSPSATFKPTVDSTTAFNFTTSTDLPVLTIDTQNRRIGIDNASPTSVLDILQSADLKSQAILNNTSNTASGAAEFLVQAAAVSTSLGSLAPTNTSFGFNRGYVTTSGGSGLDIVATSTNNDVRIYTGGYSSSTERLRVNALGNVGIGTGTNLSRLTVVQPADATNIGGTTVSNASTTITGVGTTFTTTVGVGDRISLSSSPATYATVTAVTNDTTIVVDTALGDGTSQTINLKKSIVRADDSSGATKFLINDQGNIGLGIVSGLNSKLNFAAGTTASGGILFGSDTNLYRSAPDTLKTDDNFIFGGSLSTSGPLVVLSTTTPQLTVGYDTNNTWTTSTNATGTTTFNFRGTNSTAVFVPQNNSVTAFDFRKADGTTSVLDIDTTNTRVGINNASPTTTLDVNGTFLASGSSTLASTAGYTFTAGNATGTSTINGSAISLSGPTTISGTGTTAFGIS
ncbi:MAG: collagen-like protein, partial [Patescibacteria group bacterium]